MRVKASPSSPGQLALLRNINQSKSQIKKSFVCQIRQHRKLCIMKRAVVDKTEVRH